MLRFEAGPAPSAEWKRDARGRWSGGATWLEPFRNPAVESTFLHEAGRATLLVRERQRGHGPLREHVIGSAECAAVVEETRAWPLEFAMVHLTDTEVTVEAGMWGSAPIHLADSKTTLVGSWDPVELRHVRGGPTDLDRQTAADFLVRGSRYSTRTIFRGVPC